MASAVGVSGESSRCLPDLFEPARDLTSAASRAALFDAPSRPRDRAVFWPADNLKISWRGSAFRHPSPMTCQ